MHYCMLAFDWVIWAICSHLVQRGGVSVIGECTTRNILPINGHCTNHHVSLWYWCLFTLVLITAKELTIYENFRSVAGPAAVLANRIRARLERLQLDA